jgi:RNA-directed DNA polymerase
MHENREISSAPSPLGEGRASSIEPKQCGSLKSLRNGWRMVAKLKTIKVELLHRKHDRISQVGAWLRKVVNGYYQYHAVPGNIDQLRTFRQRVNQLWRNVLVRRSQRAKKRWELLTPVFDRWIPIPRILHPYPHARFNATHPS